ncbi:HAMP domain-containing sensor histidine kinase [Glutamicibacter endophyticus]|uniref:sensor histidine kinase n=1 Tax=Glutamicibacter sp. PS TaxID=3075634 RepID=UPI002850A855|nr:HAMP domain-containing sensor histidine kinase [Glutamicibacter sp. PS]MDR4533841.1 HAMP domain-containing histidine kinase [Glutamicibacter sp. PS]
MQALRRSWRRTSLRTKLVMLMCALMTVGVLATAVGSAHTLRISLTKQLDEQLISAAPSLGYGLNKAYLYSLDADNGNTGGVDPSLLGLNRAYADIRDAEGTIEYIMPTNRVASEHSMLPLLGPKQIAELNANPRTPITVPGSYTGSAGWRAISLDLKTSGLHFYLALPLDTVSDTVQKTAALVLSTGLLATLLMSMIAYGVTTRALAPLLRVERTASLIADGDLTQRVQDYPPETEVGRLSRSLNAMLAQIERAFKDREASERKMRRFIQDASHELRTPLVTIQGYSEFYRHGGLASEEAVGSAMGRIEAESKRMAQLVEDLLMLARLDEQRPLEMNPVDLLVIGQDAVEDTRVRAPERTVTLVGLDGPMPAPASTTGDDARIRQIIANLLTNALRYTPEGSPIEIAVGVRSLVAGASDAVLEVRDHGPGIPEEDAQRVFERFYRADSSRQRETGGSGLGLAIVSAIAGQHGGSVSVSETPGGGTTMSISLPFVPPEN